MISPPRLTASILLTALTFQGGHGAEPAVDFNRDIRPILSNRCFTCHGPDDKVRKADLRLDTRKDAIANEAIVPGDPAKSSVIERVTSKDAESVMPPPKSGKKLTQRETDLLAAWIKQGAPYANHWSHVKPVRPPLPVVKNKAWPRNGIDAFILARLEKEGLASQPEADRTSLARRVALDLTGLPPTLAEVDEFVKDTADGAYERYVDRLLAKPAYGEHWARLWLDLARYADSAGYADDPARTIWAYRDYVIRSFNANKPFDQFTIEQIAGDMLPNATDEQVIATAFHRNTMTNSEGGTNDEEFRNVAVVDRVNTTLAVWMGTSIACAQCHNHKYDPISQVEYFRVFAMLNNTEDADRNNEAPLLTLADPPERKAKREELESRIEAIEKAAKALPGLVQGGLKLDVDRLRKKLNEFQADTVPVMRELPKEKSRVTKLQFRGSFMDLGDEVKGGVPAVFAPLPGEANRLALARWLVADDNPLTARVSVNRFWEAIFGTGLVRTSEEFGIQGELPSHPELLDWMAVEFSTGENRWDLKRFLKLLVTSAAYRQSSKVTPALLEKDPDNRLLSRGPRFRLSAEMVRDQALAVSGLLSSKMYGPSVKPLQPSFGLSAAFGRTLDWQPSTGEDRYRRGLYTEWRRTNPYPSMAAFDAPSREACTLRRNRSNTPLQALVTLNDPVYMEAAQALAERMNEVKGSLDDRLTQGFRRCLARSPNEKELTALKKLTEEARSEYTRDPELAAKLVKNRDANLAALTVAANVMLNLDEMFLKR